MSSTAFTLPADFDLHTEQGPGWLFVRLIQSSHRRDAAPLAERIWAVLDRQFTYRVVVEMDEVPVLYSRLIGELVKLHKRVATHGGVVRLSGLSTGNEQVLHINRLDRMFPCYADRQHAVMGHFRPPQPR